MTIFAFRDGLKDLAHPPRTNIAALDVLRSAAILLVLTGHYLGVFHASTGVQRFPVFRWGWTGVDLFFVLSGLLIGSQLWKELDRTGRIRIGHFLLRRGLRIWPLYYSFVLFAVVGCLLKRNITAVWPDAFFLSNLSSGQVAGGWSLSTEEQFYILTPILLSLFVIKLSPRRMWIVPCLAIAALVSTRAWVIAYSVLPESILRREVLYFPIYTHADGLAVGVFLAWLSVFHKERLRSKLFPALGAAAMFALGLLLYWMKPLLLNFTSLGLIYGSLELYGISTLPFPHILRWRGFYVISRLSFGLYLNHFFMLTFLERWLSGWSSRSVFTFWVGYLFCLTAYLLVAAITFLLIEWPFLRIRARWVDRERLTAAPRTQGASVKVRLGTKALDAPHRQAEEKL
jgi:peptidoglycan/LPS O-acetylase OafA/YrhL